MNSAIKQITYLTLLISPLSAFAESGGSDVNIYQLISTIVLIVTLLFLILTYLNAHRPYVGITRSDANYDQNTNELSFRITIKNSGNVTARGIKTDSKTYENENVISDRKGESTFILFPNQESHGILKFHGITNQHFQHNVYSANYLIYYEQPITLGFKRNFKTVQRMKYDPEVGNLRVESGDVD